MTISIVKGQKADLTKVHQGLSNLTICIGWNAPNQIELDTSAFLLTQNGKVTGDADLIFYGNPTNAFMTYTETKSNERELDIKLLQIASSVEKIAFTLTIYEGEARSQNFSLVNSVYIRFINKMSGQEILRYELGNHFSIETAIVIGELYRYNSEWKFNAIGAGYAGGLNVICASYGIDVKSEPDAAQVQLKEVNLLPKKQPIPPIETNTEKPVQLNLSKIELKKKGDKINLEKKSGGLGEILINLNWNQQAGKSKGFWNKSSSGVDLDLACLYELKDGSLGVIQALGESFGSLTRAPYIMLDGDDRTGSVKTGENIRINGSKLKEFRRILVFTFIYEGVTRWSEADGVVTLTQNGGPDIIVKLDEHDNNKHMCAIALIQNVNDETFSMERIVSHFTGHRELDQAFHWGLRWKAGSK
jgi:tellurite resistance protein TerA